MEIIKIIEEIKSNAKSLVRLQEENKLINIINKGLILGKNPDALATEIIGRFSNIASVSEIVSLISVIKDGINTNSEGELLNDDIMHAEQIAINQLNKNPNVKTTELLKDIKVALSIRSHDEKLKAMIDTTRAKYLVDFSSLGIDPRFKPSRRDFQITEEKKGVFLATAPSNSKPTGYVIGFAKNRLFFLGYKDGVEKEGYTRNSYYVKLIFGMIPGGKIIREINKEIICKGIPLEEIPDSLANDIIMNFSNNSNEIIIGASITGGNPRLLNGKIQLEKMPLTKLLDHLQARILISGRTGDGKTVWANLFQRQLMEYKDYLQGGIVSITRDVDNLANAGEKFTPFSPNWDEGNMISKAFAEKVNLEKTNEFKKITICGENLLPDINKLSKETLFSMVANSDCSEQVKTALKRHIEESKNVVDVFEKAKRGELLGEEYTGAQDDALRRLMNALIPVNYKNVKKIDLKKVLEQNKYLGFFIKGLNSDVYGTIIVHELYNLQKNKMIRNPLKEGRLLLIDEVQKYIRYNAFKEIFEMCVLDGRGFGIMILGIIQSPDQATKLCAYKDFILYKAMVLEDGKRAINIDEKIAIIPPLAPEVA